MQSSIKFKITESQILRKRSNLKTNQNIQEQQKYEDHSLRSIIRIDKKKPKNYRQTVQLLQKMAQKKLLQLKDQYYLLNYLKYIRKMFKELYLQSKCKYRKCIFQELRQTEENYIKDIGSLIDLIVNPCKQYLSNQEISQCFSNLQQIYEFNRLFAEALKNINQVKFFIVRGQEKQMQINLKLKSDEWLPNQQSCASILKLIPYFKFYSQYCIDYPMMQKKIKELMQTNNYLVQENINNPCFRNQDLFTFLIKPIQRVPKYVLLLKDYLKHTFKQHVDYDNISTALILFEGVNDTNNKNMDKLLYSKLEELQKQVGVQNNLIIVSPQREFICEEPLTILERRGRQKKDVIGYFMNDMILIMERIQSTQKFHCLLELNQNSFLRNNLEDRLMFILGGVGQTTYFLAENPTEKEKIIKIIQDLIDNLQQKRLLFIQNSISTYKKDLYSKQLQPMNQSSLSKEYKITITIKGTEEDNNSTIYCFDISIESISTVLKVTSQEIFKIFTMVQKYLPSLKVSIPNDLNCSKDSKITALYIQSFLISLLSSREFQSKQKQKECQEILQLLGLSKDFYGLPKKQKNLQTGDLLEASESFFKNVPQIEKQATQQKSLLQNTRHDNRFLQSSNLGEIDVVQFRRQRQNRSEERQNRSEERQRSMVKQERRISVTKLTQTDAPQITGSQNIIQIKVLLLTQTVTATIQEETRSMHLISQIANRIELKEYNDFRLIQEGTGRILHPDEIIYKLFNQIEQRSIFSRMKGLFVTEYNSLLMRKIIFFYKDIEYEKYSYDNQRLQLIVAQVFQEIDEGKFTFHESEQLMIMGLYFAIQHFSKKQYKINKESLLKFLKNTKVMNMNDMIKQVQTRTGQIVEDIIRDTEQSQILVKVQRIFLFLVSKHKLYGVQVFPAQIRNQQNTSHNEIVQICISIKGIQIMNSKNNYIIDLDYDLLNVIEANGNSLNISTLEGANYNFITVQSFRIKQFCEDYTTINEEILEQETEFDLI